MRRPGFTVLELATAVALLLTFVAIAIPVYRAFESRGGDQAARHRLAAIEVEVARAQVDNGGVFPAEIHAHIPGGSDQIVDGDTPSERPSMLSLHTIAPDAVAGAVLSDSGHCLVVVFTVNDEAAWAIDQTPAGAACRAAHPAIADERSSWFAGEDQSVNLN